MVYDDQKEILRCGPLEATEMNQSLTSMKLHFPFFDIALYHVHQFIRRFLRSFLLLTTGSLPAGMGPSGERG